MPSSNITASIITIGDELLIGQTIDTNSAWMAQQLNTIGIQVINRVAVGDDRQAIWKALDDSINNASVVLITGGLGPTADDITKPLLCDYFGGNMIVNQEVLDHVKYIFSELLNKQKCPTIVKFCSTKEERRRVCGSKKKIQQLSQKRSLYRCRGYPTK
jgi:nicotinamide-nucleotide amidase